MYCSSSATVGGMFTAKRVFVPARSPEEDDTKDEYDPQDEYETQETPVVKPKKMKGRLPGVKLLRRLEAMRIKARDEDSQDSDSE